MAEPRCYKCGEATGIAINITINKTCVEVPVCSVHKDALLAIIPDYEAVCKEMIRAGVKPGITGMLVGRMLGARPS